MFMSNIYSYPNDWSSQLFRSDMDEMYTNVDKATMYSMKDFALAMARAKRLGLWSKQEQLAEKSGVSQSQISRAVNAGRPGNPGIGLDDVMKLLGALGAKIVFPGEEVEDYALVPRIEGVKLSAGGGHEILECEDPDQRFFAFRRSWLIHKRLNPDKLSVYEVQGDSMYPTIEDKSIVLVSRKDIKLVDGRIYAIATGGMTYVKRYFSKPQKELFSGDNRALSFLDVEIDHTQDQATQHVDIIGRVVWSGKEL